MNNQFEIRHLCSLEKALKNSLRKINGQISKTVKTVVQKSKNGKNINITAEAGFFSKIFSVTPFKNHFMVHHFWRKVFS